MEATFTQQYPITGTTEYDHIVQGLDHLNQELKCASAKMVVWSGEASKGILNGDVTPDKLSNLIDECEQRFKEATSLVASLGEACGTIIDLTQRVNKLDVRSDNPNVLIETANVTNQLVPSIANHYINILIATVAMLGCIGTWALEESEDGRVTIQEHDAYKKVVKETKSATSRCKQLEIDWKNNSQLTSKLEGFVDALDQLRRKHNDWRKNVAHHQPVLDEIDTVKNELKEIKSCLQQRDKQGGWFRHWNTNRTHSMAQSAVGLAGCVSWYTLSIGDSVTRSIFQCFNTMSSTNNSVIKAFIGVAASNPMPTLKHILVPSPIGENELMHGCSFDTPVFVTKYGIMGPNTLAYVRGLSIWGSYVEGIVLMASLYCMSRPVFDLLIKRLIQQRNSAAAREQIEQSGPQGSVDTGCVEKIDP